VDPLYLFTALCWGAIGFGFFIYGRKQRRPVPMIGGILLIASSYAARTPLTLSMVGIAVVFGMYALSKRF
jgi:hypothetical protein